MKKPNLVYIFSDQQSKDMLGCYGNNQIITPNIDSFSQEGVRFEHAVANCPVCTPCRSMMITGQHPLHNNCFDNDRRMLTRDEIGAGIGDLLSDQEYQMGYVGKWHLYGGERDRPVPNDKNRHGFNDYFLTNNCHMNYDPDHSYFWNDQGEKEFFNKWEVEGQADQAIEFIDQVNDEKPFCLYLSWHAPHNHNGGDEDKYSQFDAPEEFKDLYNIDTIVPRPHLENNEKNRLMTLGYYAMCTEVDHHFGRILKKLKERGFDENTLVVFTSDHGETFGAHAAQCHKGNPEDVSIRVPLIMRYPKKLEENQVSNLLIGALDYAPTLYGLLGNDAPEWWQGKDLSKAIASKDDNAVESLPIFNFKPSWRGVYTKQYTFALEQIERTPDLQNRIGSDLGRKYTRNHNVLYDRDADPLQLNNLINSTKHIETAIELTEQMHEWCAQFDDPFLSYKRMMEKIENSTDTPPVKLLNTQQTNR